MINHHQKLSHLVFYFRFSQEYTTRNAIVAKEGPNYLANPVNAYVLIKRLTSDWNYVESMMKNNMADEFINNITQRRQMNQVRYPDQEDLNGAAIGKSCNYRNPGAIDDLALLRLQDTYRMDTRDLANGIILGESTGQQLNGLFSMI